MERMVGLGCLSVIGFVLAIALIRAALGAPKCGEVGCPAGSVSVSIMPKGPRGEKRPANAIGLAVMIGKIATGEIEDEREAASSAAAQLGSLGDKKRAANMTPERRSEIAKEAAAKRWGRKAD